MDRKLVLYILSPGRTGSTILDIALGSHSECTSLGEFVQFERHGADYAIENCRYCNGECEFWSGIKSRCKPPHYHDAAFQVAGTSVLIDSSKEIEWLEKAMKNTDAEFKIIRLTRDLLYHLSKGKRKRVRKNICGIDLNQLLWVIGMNSKIDRYISRFPSEMVMTLRYEDLGADPEACLKSICLFAGLIYEPGMLEYYKHAHHVIGGSGETMQQVRFAQGLISKDELHPDALERIEKYGFKIKTPPILNDGIFNKKEKSLALRLGAWQLRQYGYIGQDEGPSGSYICYHLAKLFSMPLFLLQNLFRRVRQ